MNAAALNHCLFIMSPKCSRNGGFNVASALPEVLCVCMYVIEEIEMVSALITQGQWPCWLVGYCDNVMTRPKVTLD